MSKTPQEVMLQLVNANRLAALRGAAFDGDLDEVKRLLSLGCAIDGDASDQTPLVCAIEGDQLECAKWLVGAGANPNAPGSDGWRPLHDAVDLMIEAQVQNGPMPDLEARMLTIVEWLLTVGADPALTDAQGQTPWTIACQHQELPVLEKLRPLIGHA